MDDSNLNRIRFLGQNAMVMNSVYQCRVYQMLVLFIISGIVLLVCRREFRIIMLHFCMQTNVTAQALEILFGWSNKDSSKHFTLQRDILYFAFPYVRGKQYCSLCSYEICAILFSMFPGLMSFIERYYRCNQCQKFTFNSFA